MDGPNRLVEAMCILIVRINGVVCFGVGFRRMSIGYKNKALGNDTERSFDSGLVCGEVLPDTDGSLSSIYLLGLGGQEQRHFAERAHDGSSFGDSSGCAT